MTELAQAAGDPAPRRSIIDVLELDVRLLGMLVAFLAIALIFTIWTGGTFVIPRNVFNITV